VRDERENNQINKTAAPARPSRLSRSASIAFFFPHTQFLFFSLFKGEKRPRQRETRVQSVKMTSIVFLLSPHTQEIGWEERRRQCRGCITTVGRDNDISSTESNPPSVPTHLFSSQTLSRDSAEIFLVVFKHFFWISRDNRRGQWAGNFADIFTTGEISGLRNDCHSVWSFWALVNNHRDGTEIIHAGLVSRPIHLF
jgi:hypothetical protein